MGDDRVLVSDNAGGGHVVAVSCQTEIEDNGIDEDCDGYDALCHTGSCGTDIVVTEFLTSPVNGSPSDGVWVEVANFGSAAVDLKNMEIVTTNGTWAISGHLVASPGEHVLVAASAALATNGGVVPDQVLAGLDLPPNAGFVQLNASGGGVLDLVPYVPAFSTGVSWPAGASVSLDPSQSSANANDQPFSWCDGRSFFGAGDFGTPGSPNESCTYDLVFDLTYQMVVPPNVELFGLATTFAGRTFSTSNSGEGTFTRTTTPLGGTVLNWTYNTTGVVYTGTQTFGENCIPGGAMSNLPASASSGAWNDLICP